MVLFADVDRRRRGIARGAVGMWTEPVRIFPDLMRVRASTGTYWVSK